MSKMRVPLCRPSITAEEIELVAEVLRSGWLAEGEHNRRFEAAVAARAGATHAVALNSCTSALELALQASGVRGEVLVPSFTFVASANAVACAGATPVLCEVDRATRNVTADLLRERLTPRTEAVMVVHYGGQACAMDDIVSLCEERHLVLIEDSAETLGATWRGEPVGSFGVGCFSFFPTKAITTGEGGMLVCRDESLARKVRALASHGLASSTLERTRAERPWWREADLVGHNYRLPHPLAALGCAQLQRLDALNARRAERARRYDRELVALAPDLLTPAVAEGATHVYQMYTVLVGGGRRDALVRGLRARGVEASVHFQPPVHLHPAHLRHGGGPGSLPVCEQLAEEIVTLPLFPDMTDEEQAFVVQALTDQLAELRR
jgi:perosamine synthetase